MARIRSVKPETWSDQKLARLSRDARLLYIALWNFADEQGRMVGDPRQVKGMCLPMDDDLGPKEIDVLLDELASLGRVRRYVIDDEHFLFLPHLSKHQRLDTGQESRYPEPPDNDSAPTPQNPGPTPGKSGEVSGQSGEVRGESGKPRPRARAYVAGGREQVAGVPPTAGRAATAATVTPIPTAQTFVAAYVDAYRGRAGHDPPSRVKGQLAKELGRLISDGIPTEAIKAGFIEWFDRDQHPSTLASFVETNGRGGRPRASPTRSQRQLDQARQTYEEMTADAPAGVGEHRGPPQPELARPADHQADR